jgi:hypothetical protein
VRWPADCLTGQGVGGLLLLLPSVRRQDSCAPDLRMPCYRGSVASDQATKKAIKGCSTIQCGSYAAVSSTSWSDLQPGVETLATECLLAEEAHILLNVLPARRLTTIVCGGCPDASGRADRVLSIAPRICMPFPQFSQRLCTSSAESIRLIVVDLCDGIHLKRLCGLCWQYPTRDVVPFS